jgi:hypothetical protein
LKDTNRNDMGFVDFESVYGVDGVGIANMVANSREVEGGREAKKLQSRITFDDGTCCSQSFLFLQSLSDLIDHYRPHLVPYTTPFVSLPPVLLTLLLFPPLPLHHQPAQCRPRFLFPCARACHGCRLCWRIPQAVHRF